MSNDNGGAGGVVGTVAGMALLYWMALFFLGAIIVAVALAAAAIGIVAYGARAYATGFSDFRDNRNKLLAPLAGVASVFIIGFIGYYMIRPMMLPSLTKESLPVLIENGAMLWIGQFGFTWGLIGLGYLTYQASNEEAAGHYWLWVPWGLITGLFIGIGDGYM